MNMTKTTSRPGMGRGLERVARKGVSRDTASAAEPPEEAEKLLNKDYAYLKKLDTRGWRAQLLSIVRLSVENDLGLVEVLPNMMLLSRVGSGATPRTMIWFHPVPTVQFIRPREGDFRLAPNRQPALIVNVNAPDAVIFSELKRALKVVRRVFPAPVAKPGRVALNSLFDEHTFAKWRREQIVPLAELLAWRATLGKRDARHYPDHVLGEWLGMTGPKHTSEAKATLKKALASLPALTAQFHQDGNVVEDMMEQQDLFRIMLDH